jgi:transglutaminase-like putative cysteine protease
VLVTVASATLWITQQLGPWVAGVQLAAFALSLWRREQPLAWQRSALVLDLGMLAIVAVTVAVALRGEPSTIALAHFAALTQGLQLLDARPRRTEFLLVTLALFQVVLAANLTDSVLFPPLLVACVLATVWTLLVHTLRMEALAAGDPGGASRAITPGLLRTTLVASGLAVVLALVLFVLLPRLRTNVWKGSGAAPILAAAGFSDRVALGEIGRIRQDPRVSLRVETLDGEAPAPGAGYWRGLAFDHFDGTAWSITPPGRELVAGSAEIGVGLGRRPDEVDLRQRIVREPVEAGVIFGAGEIRQLHGGLGRLEHDRSGGVYAPERAEERVHYTVATRGERPPDAALNGDRAVPPSLRGERYLQLPALAPRVGELARELTGGRERDLERVLAVEGHLLRNGRYTNVPPWVDPGGERSPIEAFLLGELAGHCEYFASAMVVLLRSAGIPARLVNGFAGGTPNEIGGFLELTRSDAHTWVEVHFAAAGWVRFDPTPPDLRTRRAVALSLAERLRQLGSAAELWWYQRVVGFERADQIAALRRAWLAWRAARAPRSREPGAEPPAPSRGRWGDDVPDWLPAAGLALAAGGAALAAWRRRRRPGAQVPLAYRRALRLLARRGLVRGPATPAREFAARVAAVAPPAAGAAFHALTEAYLAERFGGARTPASRQPLRVLRRSLPRGRLRTAAPGRGRLSPGARSAGPSSPSPASPGPRRAPGPR